MHNPPGVVTWSAASTHFAPACTLHNNIIMLRQGIILCRWREWWNIMVDMTLSRDTIVLCYNWPLKKFCHTGEETWSNSGSIILVDAIPFVLHGETRTKVLPIRLIGFQTAPSQFPWRCPFPPVYLSWCCGEQSWLCWALALPFPYPPSFPP